MDMTTQDVLRHDLVSRFVGRSLNDRYEIFEHLASSSVGHVFRAWDHQLERIVAIKVLDPRLAAADATARSFEHHACRVASLPPHHTIVSVHQVDRENGLPYVVMEYVAGTNLQQRLACEAPLPMDQAVTLACQITQGLDFAHTYGIIHGHLTPQNVLITRGNQVKLTDFGVLQPDELPETDETWRPITASPYLSPEQARGAPGDVRSDVYAVGVLLYEMLTGTLPFEADHPLALVLSQVQAAPADPRHLTPAISSGAAEIVLRALNPVPEQRYQTAGALGSSLQEQLLLEQGVTPRYGYPRPPLQYLGHVHSLAAPPRAKAASRPLQRRRRPDRQMQRFMPTRVVFLAAFLVASLTAWWAYRGLSSWFHSWGSVQGMTSVHHSSLQRTHRAASPGHHPGRHGATTAGLSSTVNPNVQKQGTGGAGCTAGPSGSIRLLRIWAEALQVTAGQPLTFDYTVANDTSTCQQVSLGVTAYSDSQPGTAVSDPSDVRVIRALPGIHMYKRQFVFPPTAAGQTFDVLLSVGGGTQTQPSSLIRVNHLVTVE